MTRVLLRSKGLLDSHLPLRTGLVTGATIRSTIKGRSGHLEAGIRSRSESWSEPRGLTSTPPRASSWSPARRWWQVDIPDDILPIITPAFRARIEVRQSMFNELFGPDTIQRLLLERKNVYPFEPLGNVTDRRLVRP